MLVLDLDPQTNATLALVGEERWAKADTEGQTLAHLFLDLLGGTAHFEARRAILRGVSNLNRVPADVIEQLPPEAHYGRVDLLPSSIRLIDVQDRMQDIAARSHYAVSRAETRRAALRGLRLRPDRLPTQPGFRDAERPGSQRPLPDSDHSRPPDTVSN